MNESGPTVASSGFYADREPAGRFAGHDPDAREAVSAAALLLLLAAAQEPPIPVQDPDPCDAGRIAEVRIDNNSIFDLEEVEESRFDWAYGAANSLHFRTRRWVIRRELLVAPGDCYDPFLLTESERLLRNYAFLARARVTAERGPDGWIVDVVTYDEWSTKLDVRVGTEEGLEFEGVSVREDNLLGTGNQLGFFWLERRVTREYGASFHSPQLFRTRWDFTLEAGRTRPGGFLRQEIAYPFVGEVSEWSGRQRYVRADRLFDYITGTAADTHVLLPVRENFFGTGVIRRIGREGAQGLLGAGLTFHELSYPGSIEAAPGGRYDDRVPADSVQSALVMHQARELHNIRASVLLGHRNIWWVKRKGLDSMQGEEDVRLGAEAMLTLGRSLASLETDDDLFVAFSFYSGIQSGDGLVLTRLYGDTRRNLRAPFGEPEWEDLYAEAELLAYWQTRALAHHTLLLRAAAVGAWDTRTPFQLTLGGETALRGYDAESFPGGRRVVISAEDRVYIGWPMPEVFDAGITTFVDVGRIFPGDVPFGTDSGWRASAGIGLRGALPAGGRTTYRIDFAWPLGYGYDFSDFRIRFSIGEPLGMGRRTTDFDVSRVRPMSVAADLFQR